MAPRHWSHEATNDASVDGAAAMVLEAVAMTLDVVVVAVVVVVVVVALVPLLDVAAVVGYSGDERRTTVTRPTWIPRTFAELERLNVVGQSCYRNERNDSSSYRSLGLVGGDSAVAAGGCFRVFVVLWVDRRRLLYLLDSSTMLYHSRLGSGWDQNGRQIIETLQ